MCTAITLNENDCYFGRTLDFDKGFGEKVVITPRNMPVIFKKKDTINTHYAIIGTAMVNNNYPLYYDAVNEKGLGMAGLNFPDNAAVFPYSWKKDNIAPYELILWILSQCDSVEKATELLKNINIINEPFSEKLSLPTLHWIIADKKESVTVECTQNGIDIIPNPVGVLTNNPPFEYQMFNLSNYMHLTNKMPENLFFKDINLKTYCHGLGSLGLPGDTSSASRFVRATFNKFASVSDENEESVVTRFFHILDSVGVIKGTTIMENGNYDKTIYSSCCNMSKGIYYYITYENRQINAVSLNEENKNCDKLITFDFALNEQINYLN